MCSWMQHSCNTEWACSPAPGQTVSEEGELTAPHVFPGNLPARWCLGFDAVACSTITECKCCTLWQDSLCCLDQHTEARLQCKRLNNSHWPWLQQRSLLSSSVSSLPPDMPAGCSRAWLGQAHQTGCSMACRESQKGKQNSNPRQRLPCGPLLPLSGLLSGRRCLLSPLQPCNTWALSVASPCKADSCSVQARAPISKPGWRAASRQCCRAELQCSRVHVVRPQAGSKGAEQGSGPHPRTPTHPLRRSRRLTSEPQACTPTTTGSSCVHLTSRRICRQWGHAAGGFRASHRAVLTEAGDFVRLPREQKNLHGLAGAHTLCDCAMDWGSRWTP